MKRAFILLLFTFHFPLLTSHALAAGAGTSAAQFLKLGVGARYLAMGEAAVSVTDDVNSLYWNPANLSYLDAPSLSVMYGAYVESVNYQYAAFAGRMGKLGSLGASMQMLSAGTLNQTDDTGRALGTLLPRDLAAGLGWGRLLTDRLAAGVGAKLVQSRIVDTASTFAGDAGLSWYGDRIFISAAARHIGGRLKYSVEEDDLPLTYQGGISYQATRRWLLAVDGIFPNDTDGAVAAGTEYAFPLRRASAVFFRAGYNSRHRDIPGWQGVSAGLGGRWNFLDVDYAWVPMGDLGQTHRVSLTARFARTKTGRAARSGNRP